VGDYVSQSDLESRIGSPLLIALTNSDQTASTVNTTALTQAIAEAEGELNGYIGQQYDLPLSSPYPAIVVGLARRMAVYHVYALQPDAMTEGVAADYDRAVRSAERIATGKLSLGLDTAGSEDDTADSGRTTVRRGGEDRRFTRSKMSSF
jgi:phage gp36-like protein